MSSLRSTTTTNSSFTGSGMLAGSSLRHATFRRQNRALGGISINLNGNGGGRVRRWIQKLKMRRSEYATTFEKAYPDYILGDDIGPSEYDYSSRNNYNSSNVDATWTSKPTQKYIPVGTPPIKAEDEYVDFMRGKAAPRYMSFSEGIDIDSIDLTAPAKRRLSFRWSEVAARSGRFL